jgi:nucleotide-binding universal stress UspA family protein
MMDTPHAREELAAARRNGHAPVLVAVGRAEGLHTIRTAHAIAARDASPLVVLSVVEPPPVYAFESNRALLVPWVIEQQLEERRASVHARLRSVGLAPISRSEPSVDVRYGGAAETIATAARDLRARLIVMGIGPRAPRQRLLAAGTPWEACRLAGIPVLAVGDDARELARVAVVAIDFSPESVHAASAALPLLADGADVYLVHAWTRLDPVFPSAELVRLNDSYAASLPEQFERVRDALGRHLAVKLHTLALEGPPAELVLSVARAKGADLVVAGTHGRGMVERWLLGSTSSALLRGAASSVLLVPPPPATARFHLLRHLRGTSAVREPEQWDGELRQFVQRNQDRRTRLEIDDPAFGAQVQESGLALVGATYDPRAHRVELMFGGRGSGDPHFTRTLGHVRSLAVSTGPRHVDSALFIENEGGGTLLTFLEQPAAASSADA